MSFLLVLFYHYIIWLKNHFCGIVCDRATQYYFVMIKNKTLQAENEIVIEVLYDCIKI